MFDCHRYVKCPNVGFCFMSAISVCCSWLLRIWTDTINLAALWESRQTICFLFSRGLFSYSWSLQEPSLKLNRCDICFQMSRVRRTKNMKAKAKNLHKNAYFCFCLVPLSCPWCTVRNREGFEETVECGGGNYYCWSFINLNIHSLIKLC